MATKKTVKKAVKTPAKKDKKPKKIDGNVVRRKAAKEAARKPKNSKVKGQPDAAVIPSEQELGFDEPILDEDDFFADDMNEVDPLDEGEDSTPEPSDE